MKKNEELPYPECSDCQDLGDCKHPDVTMDGFSSPMPPDNCPKGMEILKKLYNKRKHDRPFN